MDFKILVLIVVFFFKPQCTYFYVKDLGLRFPGKSKGCDVVRLPLFSSPQCATIADVSLETETAHVREYECKCKLHIKPLKGSLKNSIVKER